MAIEINLWDAKNKPASQFYGTIYTVALHDFVNHKRLATIYVEVDSIGMISLGHYSFWFGQSHHNDTWTNQTVKEVLEWLSEWELIERKAIGPDDYEYFATDSLTEDSEG